MNGFQRNLGLAVVAGLNFILWFCLGGLALILVGLWISPELIGDWTLPVLVAIGVVGAIRGVGLGRAAAAEREPEDGFWSVFGAAILGRLGRIVLVVVLGPLGLMLTNPRGMRSRSQGQLTACKSNLKNLGTALEMYSTDNAGHYPADLGKLTPNYLKTIPTCPSAGSVTYQFLSASNPDNYSVICAGHFHEKAGMASDFPQYTSIHGLIERP